MKIDKKVGRKLKYGEKTVLMRIPASMVPDVEAMLSRREVFTDKWFDSQLPPAAEKLIDQLSQLFSAPGIALREDLNSMMLVHSDGIEDPQERAKKLNSVIVMQNQEQELRKNDIDAVKPIIRDLLVDLL